MTAAGHGAQVRGFLRGKLPTADSPALQRVALSSSGLSRRWLRGPRPGPRSQLPPLYLGPMGGLTPHMAPVQRGLRPLILPHL